MERERDRESGMERGYWRGEGKYSGILGTMREFALPKIISERLSKIISERFSAERP